ncbi:MAG TPA: metallophosphoesterase family protein [Dehalococcoidales bacterium]
MHIGLISDSHIAWPQQFWPSQIKEKLRGVDLILHAGDIWIPWVLDELEAIAPVLAARGDDDLEEDIGNDRRISQRQTLSYEGVSLWVIHVKPRYGQIDPSYEMNFYNMYNRHFQEEVGTPPDVVVFGHTHSAEIEQFKNTLLVNPGSPTMPQYMPQLGTVGLLTLKNGKIDAKIIPLG